MEKEKGQFDEIRNDYRSKILIYLSRVCFASHVFIYFLAWGIYKITIYCQYSKPPFSPCFELYRTGILFLFFIIFGCGACGFFFMCSSTKEEWKKRCVSWGTTQLLGAQILSLPVISFLNWGHGSKAMILFYGGGVLASGVSLIMAVAASYLLKECSVKNILLARFVCLLLLIVGSILSIISIKNI